MSASRADRDPADPAPLRPVLAVLALPLLAGGLAVAVLTDGRPAFAQAAGGPIRLVPAPATPAPDASPIPEVPVAGPPAAQDARPLPSSGVPGESAADEANPIVKRPAAVRAEPLGAPDPDGAGPLTGAQGMGDQPWQGVARSAVLDLVADLPVATPSPAVKTLQRRLLLSAGSPAAKPEDPAPPHGFGALRVAKLAAMGDPRGAAGLAALLPQALADEATARALTDAELLSDAIDCPRAIERGKAFQAAYWVKLELLCRARGADRAAAGDLLPRLREVAEPTDPFLPVAESLAGGAPPAVRTLAEADALTLAALRTLRVALPADSLSLTDPARLAAVAASEATEPAVRATAGERAAASLFLDARALTDIYRTVQPKGDELLRMADVAARDRSARSRALLHQAMLGTMDGGRRVALARLAVELVEPPLLSGPVGNAATALLDTVSPTPDAAALAPSAARLYYALGRGDVARRWHELALRTGRSADVAWLWPMGAVLGLMRPDSLAGWLDEALRGADDPARGRVAGQLALLQATGFPVPEEAWVKATGAAPPAAPDRPPTADPVLWQRLTEASAAGRVGETVLASLLLLGEGGPAAAAPLVTARVVAALRGIGLEADARAIAREAAAVLAVPPGA
ncbi:hypothetical protein [Azospirillum thermophilum]|uniref:Antifreeze protein n=1 Tax=Azospirillum thermophilum TaxID=2202148 RepID=A0A2S2CPB8_9PROT|nr:hypothetical protein [Azospirillum thermophilum]AWK86308.1 hypothetical protein DEW08_08685 [Azospirillum thermophilum]